MIYKTVPSECAEDLNHRLVGIATQGSAVNCWISVLGQSMVSLSLYPSLFSSLFLSLFPVIFSDQWRREKNQWSKVITWQKIQWRPEARPATWVPFHASAAATQTHSSSLCFHLKQHEQPDALHPFVTYSSPEETPRLHCSTPPLSNP